MTVCKVEGCRKTGTYGYQYLQALRCSIHRLIDMENVRSKRCGKDDCKSQPTYGFELGKALRCAKHADEGMETVMGKRCGIDGCKTMPSFGLEQGKALRCKQHADEDMTNVISKFCGIDECQIQRSYGLELGKPLRCQKHADEGMENVIDKRCGVDGCKTEPSQGYEYRKPLRCSKHGEDDMENVTQKRCGKDGCKTRPSLGFEFGKPLRCSTHSEDGMENVVSKRCEHDGCKKQPSHGFEPGQKSMCTEHSLEGMSNQKANTCAAELCSTIVVDNQYQGFCSRCFIYLFPEKTISKRFKIKETHVIDYIKSLMPQHDIFKGVKIYFDKQIDHGCSRRRPDIRLELFTHTLIIEIDENQHKFTETYNSCENKRMMECYKDLGYRPLVFIRFNPDSFIDDKNKKHKSCFGVHKTLDVPLIATPTQWESRLQVLQEAIITNIKNIPDKSVTIEYLYYDGFHQKSASVPNSISF